MYNQFKLMEKYFFVYRTAFVRLAILIPLTVYFACDNAYSPSYTITRCTCCNFNLFILFIYLIYYHSPYNIYNSCFQIWNLYSPQASKILTNKNYY